MSRMSLWSWCPDLRDHLLLPAEGAISTHSFQSRAPHLPCPVTVPPVVIVFNASCVHSASAVWLVSVHLLSFPLLVTYTVDFFFCWTFYFFLNSVKLVFFIPQDVNLQVNSFEYFLFSFYLVLCFVELCKMNN